ncbi:hypothetical protein AB0J83_14510 [Actinoplanes sp. NPDC049596]
MRERRTVFGEAADAAAAAVVQAHGGRIDFQVATDVSVVRKR